MKKLLFLVPNDTYFFSHRLPMARAAQQAGFDTGVVTCNGAARSEIEKHGIHVLPCNISPGLNPFGTLLTLVELIKIYRREKPQAVHHVTLKAIILGSIAAWIARVPHVVNAVAGLGYIFNSNSALARTLRLIIYPLFRILLKRPDTVVLLQNPDDAILLEQKGLVRKDQVVIIPGSGVETDKYSPAPLPPFDEGIICTFSGRMIGIKGLETLKESFEILLQKKPDVHLWLCGVPDSNNPGSWTEEQLREWAKAPNIKWKGFCRNMPEIWKQSHIALQPSYGGEGIPKALLEAAACGRTIIATNVPGCREVVTPERNGLLVPPRNAEALASAIEELAGNNERCRVYAATSPAIIEEKGLSASRITDLTQKLYESLLTAQE